MAVGTTFLALIDMLREDLGLSTNVGVGVDDLPALKRSINRSYAILGDKYRWPHLNHKATRITLNAGQRYYDFPSTLKLNDLSEVIVWQGATYYELDMGISAPEYQTFDSNEDVRAAPPQKWDLHYSGTATQIEIWPTPNANDMQLALTGTYHMPRLVDDADKCLLDDELVVLGAAIRRLRRNNPKEADAAAEEFAQRLSDVQKRTGPSCRVVMGGTDDLPNPRTRLLLVGR